MIQFNWVEYSNFLAVGSMPVRIKLDDEHTTLIRGGNGSGKTTIIDALNYACFNKPLRQVKLSQLVNSVNKKKMLVKVNFNVGGHNWEIHRGQKPAVFLIHKDGEVVDQDASSRDLQAKLETEILGTNFKTFNQVLVVASTGYTYFMELDAPGRRTVVEQMLDIEVIGQMSTLLKDRVKEVRIRGNRIEDNYTSLQRSITQVKQLIEQAKNMGDAEVHRIDVNIVAVEKLISELEGELKKHKVSHDDEVGKKPEFDKDFETRRHQEANNILSTVNQANDKLAMAVDDAQREVRRANEDIRTQKRDISAHNNTKLFYEGNDNCDRCQQPIDVDFKNNVVEEMDFKINGCNEVITDADRIIDTSEIRIDELQKQKNDLAQNLQQQQAIIKEVGQIAQNVKDWQTRCDRIINLAKQVQQRIGDQTKAKQRLVDSKNIVLSKGNVDTKEYYDQIEAFNVEIEKLVLTRAEVAEEAELCKLAEMMLKDNGLKAKIIRQFLPVINKTINYYLEEMDANYSFVLDEQFNETIRSRHRDDFSYGNFSNGQRMRINLAILFMWRKLAQSKNTVSSNVLLMDEVLDGSLDKEGIDNLFDIFNTMENANIFVISHRPEIVDRFDKVIEVTLNGNFSSYDI